MSGTKALVSFSKLSDENFRSNEAKLCFLWFEGVIFEDLGSYGTDRFVDRLLDNTVSRSDRNIIHDLSEPASKFLETPNLEDRIRKLERGYPRWGKDYENYDYPEPEDAYQYAHNQLLRAIEKDLGVLRFDDGYDIEQAEGRARIAVDAVDLWDRINNKTRCVLQARSDEHMAVRAVRKFKTADESATLPFALFKSKVPVLETVPWNEIIGIKLSGAFDNLKDKVIDIARGAQGNQDLAERNLDQHIAEAMDRIVDAHRPKTMTVTLLSALGNIPLPGVNPFGLFTSARDVASEFKKKDDFDWLYMLRDLQKQLK